MNLSLENKLKERGYQFVIGLDEAGRGPLAGPVIAAAITVLQFPISNFQFPKNLLREINDSKKLSPQKREEIYDVLKNCPEIKWGRGAVSAKVIDRINILEATKLAMKRAVKNLEKKIGRNLFLTKTILIIDGNQKMGTGFLERPIIKADEKIFSCACASVLAKVERDRLMNKYHRHYPQYNFAKHKGYPTKEHYKRIKKYGLSPLHRQTFRCYQ